MPAKQSTGDTPPIFLNTTFVYSSVYKLLNDYESYAEYEYNDVIKTVEIDSTDLIDSIKKAAMVNKLIAMAQNNKQVKALISKNTR